MISSAFSSLRQSCFFVARILVIATLALPLAACSGGFDRGLSAGKDGYLDNRPRSQQEWRNVAATWGKRYNANSGNQVAALNYARALRALDQKTQAVAILQQAAIHAPKDMTVLAAYGKGLIDVGRAKEAAEVLASAHSPEKPDWRVLSAQGTAADQLGDSVTARRYYDAALKLAPGEPVILSNLGLSYALDKKLPDAERALRQAAANPRADQRIRQNLAFVLALNGKAAEADAVLNNDNKSSPN